MFRLSFLLILILTGLSVFSQLHSYEYENRGYLSQVYETPYGYLLTANRFNDLYLYHDGKLSTLVSAPGCARYITLSPDKKFVGFKLIHTDGQQQPCLYDLQNKKIITLFEPVLQAGQPTFDNYNNIYFTINKVTYRYTSGNLEKIADLPIYVNFIRVSNDGTQMVFSIDDQGVALFNFNSQTYELISPPAAFYPQFSFDNRYIAYGSNPNLLYIYDTEQKKTYGPIQATGFKWHPSQHKLLAVQSTSYEFEILSSQIIEINIPSLTIKKLTDKDIMATGCNYASNGDIMHLMLNKNQLNRLGQKKATININTLLEQSAIFPIQDTKADVTVPGTVPYVHQVYDTPSWHAGWGSCAPTTAIMAIAYYNRLPKWPVSVTHGYSWDPHISNYGSYVADRYRFNEWYYQETADAYGTTAYGGYGYMWTGNYSPYSRMKNYIQNHYLTSNQTTTCTFAATQAEINNGYVHPICCFLTSSGHLVLAIGYKSGQYTLIFNDPYGDKNTPGYPSYDGDYVYYDWPGYNNGYVNLDATGNYGYVAWTVTARGTQPAYSDTIIDDNHFEHGFYMNNSANGSHMRYFRDFNVGFGGHCWYTLGEASGTDICYCTWTPTITSNGLYKISAFIPPKGSNTTNAKYKIYHANGIDSVIVNQNLHRNQWVDLGTYYLSTSAQRYVYLGDVTGTQGDSIAFDCIKFSPVQIDNIPPTTAISTPGNWKTQDFTATFTDNDNVGIEKAFYQVLDFDGQYWEANAQRGFFGDNFDALQPHWNIVTGTWNVSNGELLQSDESQNNTNIYAYLNQTLSNRYLYHFKVKMTGSGSTKRFGFHFFCDSASLDNRGNSYFIWFRQATSTLEFYKVVNNSFTTYQYAVNNVVTNDNQWYDIVVTYDRISGEIKVWRDNVFLGSWTDPNPLPATSGKYISFRTGNSQLYVTELKVYRSRYPTVTVTLGDSTKDIRYQNPNPQTYGAKIKSIVVDQNNNLSAIAYHDLNVDWTPPTISFVNDGTNADVDTIYDLNNASFNWHADDPNSGIQEYFYALGTTTGSDDVVSWTSAGLNTLINLTNLNLTFGQTYYFSVKAINQAGLFTILSSDGFVVSSTNVPVANFYAVDDTLYLPNAIAIFVNQSLNAVAYEWDFGDGTTSTQANPWHQYTQAGTYTVQLVAMNPPLSNDTLVIPNYIKVIDPSIINTAEFNVKIYPNPFNNIINLHFSNPFAGNIELTDVIGKVLYSASVQHISNFTITEVARLEKGHYVLIIKDDTNRIVYRQVLQK